MPLIDQDQRVAATNPFASFIVQAPAGSGKTEILTQRYLRLLSTVTAPEQIVALTFTRKAASEMRERILHALSRAAQQTVATSPHQQLTLSFAKEALKRSEELGWNLLSQPNRMKINTIDSLCQSINNSIPLLEKHLSFAQVTETPFSHYLNASRQCIEYALNSSEYQQAIKTLLLHVDNRQDKLLELFTTLLAQRDQWLFPLFQARNQDKSTFELALKYIETHELTRLKKSLHFSIAHELVTLSQEMARIENNPDKSRYALCDWTDFEAINQEYARALCALILKTDGDLRTAFDHHVGLKKDACSNDDYSRIKEQSKKLLSQLNEHPEFLEALVQVSQLPYPEYDANQWEVLQALFTLLPMLVGHLQLLFSEVNEVDFGAISQSALAALGDEDQPTDLALYLDNAIHHLLIDEFQDTSITQFDLITRLVGGWLANDGKTLFVVGDPMQSIYRFRQAEVGLFYKAQTDGIGPVALTPLQLSANFRSTATIVEWVNQRFKSIFPSQFDIESGAVAFHQSVPVIEKQDNSSVFAIEFPDKEQEAEHLIQLIQQELAASTTSSIAILVRSRSHLHQIIKRLRQQGIPYQGSDIDLLSNLPHIRDLWSLTQALLYPANRLSWLAVLRSPLCGLSLEDLHILARWNDKQSILQALQNLSELNDLSVEGTQRARYFSQVMSKALAERHHTHLSDWIDQTLTNLNADQVFSPSQKEDIAQFYTLIDRYEEQGLIKDSQSFTRELENLFSKYSMPSRLQVMTIHKSKGLEFDTVILPSLGSAPNRGDQPLLRWLKLPTPHQGTLLLVSPVQAASETDDELYRYLGRIDDEKSAYEAQRLLYVAVTRAKSKLYLLNGTTKANKGSFKSLLKQQEFFSLGQTLEEVQTSWPIPKLLQLPIEHYLLRDLSSTTFMNEHPPVLALNLRRITGVVVHLLLQQLCTQSMRQIDQVNWDLARQELQIQGIAGEALDDCLATIKKQITALFSDPVGQWILSPHHNEQNEYELLVNIQGKIATRIIDRLFETDGQFWIIDFKTGKRAESNLIKYRQQLNDYAHHCSSTTPLKIHCGIYYLETGEWLHWTYEAESAFDNRLFTKAVLEL